MRGLALEGGGAKGAYQAGAIKAFNKRGIKFDGVAGTSIGAINAAFYASGNLAGMYKLWLSTDSKEIFGIESNLIESFTNGNFNKKILLKSLDSVNNIIKNKGMDISTIRKLLTDNINENKLRKNNIDYGLVTFNISDFKPIEITKNDIPNGKLIDYIIASAYLPCFKFEKIIDDKYYFDGGIYANCPIDMFLKNGYNEVYAVKAWEGSRVRYKNKPNTKVIVIGSKERLGSILDFSPRTAKRKMELGYYDTLRVIDKLDGDKYYFKKYSEKYYSNLFDKSELKKMIKKYSLSFIPKSNKKFILSVLEKTCDDLKLKQFTIYDTPYLIVKLKYLMVTHKKSIYYDFINEIKVNFD